jgi:quercetin dioxygenase-like cupin family protein
MRASLRFLLPVAVTAGVFLAGGGASAKPATPRAALAPDTVDWQRDGCGGERIALVFGNPDEHGPFVIRLKWVPGVYIPPHLHPVDEHVTVLSGSLEWGMGYDTVQDTRVRMRPGDYSVMPAQMPHFGRVLEESVVQIHGTGPFETRWVREGCAPDSSGVAAGRVLPSRGRRSVVR